MTAEKYRQRMTQALNNPDCGELIVVMDEFHQTNMNSDNHGNSVGENNKKPFDNVTNPAHYVTGKYECIDVMTEVFGAEAVATWCKINAFKYLYRCDRKNGEEDLKKAQWYLNKHNKLIKELKKGDN